MTCEERFADLDALVMGELDAVDARALRAHAETCSVCATELVALTAERALFARRAEVLDVLASPPALAMATATATARASKQNKARRSFLPALGRIAMRGHFTAACAAALFVVAALSHLGTASVSMAMSDDVASISGDEGAVSGMFASHLEQEPLACSLKGSSAPSWHAANVMVHDDGAMTSSSSSSSSSSGASRGELLACVQATAEHANDADMCTPPADDCRR